MPIGSGLSSQFGFAPEVTYGTFVTPSRFLEFNSEKLALTVEKLRTRGINDRYQRSTRVRTYVKDGKGTVELDIQNKGFGLLFKQALGGATIAQVGTTAEWKQTFTPDPSGLAGTMATVQIGRPDVGGTVRPFNYLGGKITEWEFGAALDENVKLTTTWDFKGGENTSALAVQSLPVDSTPLSFIDGSLTIDAAAVSVQRASVKGVNSLDTDRRFYGTTKKEPIANGEMEITGQLEMEFEDLTQYNKFVAGTQSALVLTYAYGQIPTTANPFKLVVTIPVIEYTGETPQVGSSAVLKQALPFKALYNGTNPLITIDYHSSDTAY